MRFLAGAAAAIVLAVAPGCGSSRSAELYDASLQDYDDPGIKPLKDELHTLPFRHVEWEFKFREEISRITLGSEFLYLETPDYRVLAVDRFSGVMKWMYEIDTQTPLDYPPIEAYGVPDEIRAEEANLRAQNRRIEDMLKAKGAPDKEVQEAQKKRDQIRERLRQAQNGDNVYLMSRSVLYCLVRTTGNLLWTRRLNNEFAPSAQPFAIRSHIFIPGADRSRVWALEAERKGLSITSFRTEMGSHDKSITNRPLYEDPALYFVSADGRVYSYQLSGTLNWTYQTEDKLRADPVIYKLREAIDDDKGGKREKVTKFLFVGSLDHAFYALDAAGGNLIWKYETAGQIKTPAVAKGQTVYVKTEDGALFALEVNPQHASPKGPVRSGRMRWKLPLGERFLVKGKDHVYVLGPNNEIFRLNEMTGEVIGRYPLALFRHLVTNPIDDILYVAHPSGYVWALRETTD